MYVEGIESYLVLLLLETIIQWKPWTNYYLCDKIQQ